MFENKKICKECGGKCCKSLPGACFPTDFDLPGSFDKLDAALNSGKYAIDWWEGDPRSGMDEYDRGYFIRPAIKGNEGELYHPAWGGECCFLKEDGCVLPADRRPENCKKLEPAPGGISNCILHDDAGKQNAAIAWLEYYEKLNHFEKETQNA